jgi:hypothetical protein
MKMRIAKIKGFISNINPLKSNLLNNLLKNEWTEEIRAFIIWIFSLVLFFLILYLADFDFTKSAYANELMMFLFLIIFIGGLSFVYLLIHMLRNLFTKGMFAGSIIALTVCGAIVIGFFTVLAKMPSAELSKTDDRKINVVPTVAPSPSMATPTVTAKPVTVKTSPRPAAPAKTNTGSTITCIGPDDKQFETTMDDCKALNEKWGQSVDFMTNCNIHSDCGGGTVYMAKSECDKPCSGRTSNKPQVTSSTNNPSSKSNYFCVDNVSGFTYYTTSGDQCNLDNAKSICRNSVRVFVYEPCMDSCLRTANESGSNCIYNLPLSEHDSCNAAVNAEHQKCMDACGVKSQEGNSKCN